MVFLTSRFQWPESTRSACRRSQPCWCASGSGRRTIQYRFGIGVSLGNDTGAARSDHSLRGLRRCSVPDEYLPVTSDDVDLDRPNLLVHHPSWKYVSSVVSQSLLCGGRIWFDTFFESRRGTLRVSLILNQGRVFGPEALLLVAGGSIHWWG